MSHDFFLFHRIGSRVCSSIFSMVSITVPLCYLMFTPFSIMFQHDSMVKTPQFWLRSNSEKHWEIGNKKIHDNTESFNAFLQILREFFRQIPMLPILPWISRFSTIGKSICFHQFSNTSMDLQYGGFRRWGYPYFRKPLFIII